MVDHIPTLMNVLEPDPWRAKVGFSPEMQSALDASLQAESLAKVTSTFNEWIAKYQPCLFGRIAAKQSAITYCLIPEKMLFGDETDLQQFIQSARLAWTAEGFKGQTSNFIIAVLSPRLSQALPNDTVKRIALRLCSLYLQELIFPDRIYLDRLYLEQPGRTRAIWEWPVGVNYFSAQGDNRWWQDHRFPAGIAFSMNSVGHLVKSGKLNHAIHEFERLMGTADETYKALPVDSLPKALGLAMRTIHLASEAPSGKATFLLPLSEDEEDLPECPMALPADVVGMNHCYYSGFYHTDYTVPSEYFTPAVLRPSELKRKQLDFSYLFNKSLDNPDFDRMGEGRRIREAWEDITERGIPAEFYAFSKRLRGVPNELRLDDAPRLQEALQLARQSDKN